MESHYIYPFKFLFNRTVDNESYRKCCDTDHTEVSFRARVSFKLEPHPRYWSHLGFNFNFPMHPHHFYVVFLSPHSRSRSWFFPISWQHNQSVFRLSNNGEHLVMIILLLLILFCIFAYLKK